MNSIGLDIGGTYIKIGVVSSEGSIIKFSKIATTDKTIETIFEELDSIFSEYKISGIGVAIAGLVDKNGNVIKAANIPFFNDFPLKKAFEERYKVDVAVENDATVATLAESIFGEGKNCSNFILMTIGTGIGGGIWLNGSIADLPMEVGHITINFKSERTCNCGSTGCLEVYASGRAMKESLIEKVEKGEDSIVKTLYEGNFYKVTTEDIYKVAMDGDPVCRSVLKDAGKALGAGISTLINLFGPEKIILSGGVSKAVNIYVETAISEAKRRVMKGLIDKVNIVNSNLVDVGGILGAVALLNNRKP